MDGGGHDLGEGEGEGRLRWQTRTAQIQYIFPSNHGPLIRETQRLDNPLYYYLISKSNLSISNPMLFLLDNGAHSLKAGHDHNPR